MCCIDASVPQKPCPGPRLASSGARLVTSRTGRQNLPPPPGGDHSSRSELNPTEQNLYLLAHIMQHALRHDYTLCCASEGVFI